jgi:hypothetical protein|tara:strand:- start:2544 stop:11591 length:9048 start_codon:yes stop_codon:yes gene_type:complete
MTEEEFLMSLPQSLDPDEKLKRLEQWRQENPQPEVEEEVVEEEVSEQQPKEEIISSENVNFSFPSSFNNQQKPSLFSLGSDGQIDINSSIFNTSNTDTLNYQFQGTSLPTTNLNLSLGGLQNNVEAMEAQQRLTAVSKPNEIMNTFDKSYEYKYDLVDGKMIYYTRKNGTEDEWDVIDNPEDNRYFDIGAKVFKHFDYDEEAYDQGQSIIRQGKKVGKKYSSFMEESETILLDETSTEEFVDIEKIFTERVQMTDEQEENNEDAATSFVENKQRERVEVKEVTTKIGSEGGKPIYSTQKVKVKTGEMEDNPDYIAARDEAIKQLKNEKGILDKDFDLNDPEIMKMVDARIYQNKLRELNSATTINNLENYIEGLGTDFDLADYYEVGVDFLTDASPIFNTLKDKLLPKINEELGTNLGEKTILDVFDRTELQQRMEKFIDIKQSNLDNKSKKLETFMASGEDLLKQLNRVALNISKGNYQTPSQVDEANKALTNINKQIDETLNLINKKYDEFSDELEKNPDLAGFADKLKRNYGAFPLMVNNFKAAGTEMFLGVEEMAYQVYNLYDAGVDWVDDNVFGGYNLFSSTLNPAGELVSLFGMESDLEEWRTNNIELTEKWIQDSLRGTIAEAKSVSDITDFGDFVTWGFTNVGTLTPQVMAMTVSPHTGLLIVGSSAGGNKFKELTKIEEQSVEDYRKWNDLKPTQRDGESDELFKERTQRWQDEKPEIVNYTALQKYGGAMMTMGLELGLGRVVSLPFAKGNSLVSPILNRIKVLPGAQNKWSRMFANGVRKSAVGFGDAQLEGFEEGLIGVGDNWYRRYVLGDTSVNLFDGFWDQYSAGVMGGYYFKAPHLMTSVLNTVQTPKDVSNITGLQNEIKSINNTILNNPKMSANTKDILNDNVATKINQITNSINTSLNTFTQMSETDFNLLGTIDQQLFEINSQIEQIQNDDGIVEGKEQLIEDLQNERNNLTGQKNTVLEAYQQIDSQQVTLGNGQIIPIATIRKGSEVVAEQLGDTDIVRFDTTQDFIGGIETLRAEGVEVELAQDTEGNTLPADQQSYGLIATLPDGTKQVIINNASQEADGVIPADKHEVLHAFAAKMDPEVKLKMGQDLYNLLVNDTGDVTSRVEIDPRTRASLDTYRKDLLEGKIDEAQFYEEVMAVVSDGLTQGTVDVKETGPIMSLVNKFLETIGFKQSFEDGKQVIDFLKDFNKDVLSGKGLSQQTLDKAGVNLDQEVDMGLETEVDLGVVQSQKLPEATEVYMDVDNNALQQGLNNAIQNQTDQQFPIAQAIVEKNWPLISKSLNINSQQEMEAAKEVVIDQVLGQFEGSGQGKYGPRNTSALAGFSLEGGAQVSTYLAETIRTRKPEIDAAIADRTGGPGIQADQMGDVAVETDVTEVAETRRTPSQTTTYSDAILENVQTDKNGLETRITESIQESYPGRTDVTLAETRNIPTQVAQVYGDMFGINPQTLSDKTRNFQKTDADGLNAAKRFLIDNAQADFANLPDALDVDGKGTFIPLNVKKALYTDGKKTGTLKDYLDLIRIKPEKPIYRDRAGQTIRGLLNTHIRNRILETSNPDPASRKRSGAKFSKRAKVKSTQVDNRTPNQVLADMGRGPMRIQTAADGSLVVDSGPVEPLTKSGRTFPKVKASKKIDVKEVIKLEETAVDQTVSEISKAEPIPTISYQKLEKDLKPGNIKDKVYTGLRDQSAPYKKDKKGKTIETYEQARNRVVNDFLDKHPKWKSFIRRGMAGGIENSLFLSTQEYRNATANVPASVQTDILPSSIGTKTSDIQGSNKLNPKGLKDFNKDNEALKPEILIEFWGDVADFLQDNKKDAWFFGEMVNDSRNHTAGPLRSAAAYSFYPINPKSKKANFEVPILIEHGMPNFAANKPLFAAAMKGRNYVNALKDVTVASYGQGAIMNDTTTDKSKSDDDLVNVDYKNNMPAWFYTNTIPAIKSGQLNNIIDKYPGLIGPVARMSASGVNQNSYASPVDGKSIPEIFDVEVDPQFRDGANVVVAQNKAIINTLKGMTKADVQKQFKLDLKIAKDKDVATKKSLVDKGPEVFDSNMTVEKMKTVATNSLKTKVLSSKRTPKPKGISVFDFDDTLAKTKEKVIVKTPDGKTKEISAAEFAREAANLVEAGAEFDFSNFENVASDTAEGPLADLARKRQGKFGSGDIFVLTARPATAAPAIQQFLKSIGINIPLANITGLGDGSPQAKVDFVLNKTAEGYNDFYFADDSFANVEAVSQILDAVDVKNRVEQAQTKEVKLNNDINQIIEEVTGVESFKKYSTVRARLEGKKKDGGIFKRIGKQLTITASAEDFEGLTYALRGKGEQGDRHAKWINDNLLDPYNKAELELLSAKVNVGRDFAALRKKFPTLKGSKLSFNNPLLKEIDGGPFNKEQAVRVYLWNKQGNEIPDMSKRDVNRLVKAVEADIELQTFADELASIQRSPEYPAPGKNWLGGSIKNDILNAMDGSFRSELMAEFNENVDIIFSPENLNKLEAIYGSKYVEALKDSIRRMKSGSNRPVITGSGARVVNEMLDWLNASVANVMFLNSRSGLLQTLSTVNFINWGDNNLYAAAKAFGSKEMWPTFMKLMNSDYLINRRDGLRINVNEAELADAAKKGGIKGAFSYLMDKGFAITRVMDSFAIALGGSTFFINRKKALLNRVNPDTGKLYTEAEADEKAFQDFYAIAEETQQSSNPARISSQQASIAGRVLLSFQNITMQMNRKTKKSILDLYNRRKKPGMTQRESDLSNMSSVIYYVGMQNLIFNSLQQGLFAMLFDDEEEEDKRKQERFANTLNGMTDSLLFGLGFGGAIIATSKNILMRIADESDKNKPDYRDIPDDVFDVSSVIDAKFRKLKSAARTFTFERDEIKRRGWSIDNPAYLAVAQIIAAFTNAPVDRVLMKVNNLRQASDESVRTWQRVALVLGWSGWQFGLPYYGRQSTIDRENKEDEKIKENYAKQVKEVKAKGFTKKIPLSGPNHYKPKGELGVDYMQVERPDGTIQYYVKHKK